MNVSNAYKLDRLEQRLAAGYENRKLRRATDALLRHFRRRPALAQAVIEHEQDRYPLTCAALSGERRSRSTQSIPTTAAQTQRKHSIGAALAAALLYGKEALLRFARKPASAR